MTDQAWRTLRLPARDTEVTALEALLETLGALAITIEAEDDRPVFDTLDGAEPTLWTNCRIEALFPAAADPEALLAAIAGAGHTTLGARHSLLADRDWQGAFRAHFQPLRFARLWVVPSWHQVPAGAELAITLDPGMAFGTGTHPTTALCLEWLATAAAVAGRSVLDYGCGSGILAIAADRLGAREVAAIDLDPQACVVTRENAERNHCKSLMIGLPGELRPGPFDVIVANLLLQPVLALAAEFAARLAAGGRLGLSGLMVEQVPRVLEAYGPAFKMAPPRIKDAWALLIGERR
jgi:ribosomal protein L11 methyltransferase